MESLLGLRRCYVGGLSTSLSVLISTSLPSLCSSFPPGCRECPFLRALTFSILLPGKFFPRIPTYLLPSPPSHPSSPVAPSRIQPFTASCLPVPIPCLNPVLPKAHVTSTALYNLLSFVLHLSSQSKGKLQDGRKRHFNCFVHCCELLLRKGTYHE